MSDLTPWQQYKKNLGSSRPWHLLNTGMYLEDQSIVDSRMNTCNSCPELIELTKQCKKCGCVMSLKTKLTEATCPLGKW
jgi:hypothetical protein